MEVEKCISKRALIFSPCHRQLLKFGSSEMYSNCPSKSTSLDNDLHNFRMLFVPGFDLYCNRVFIQNSGSLVDRNIMNYILSD